MKWFQRRAATIASRAPICQIEPGKALYAIELFPKDRCERDHMNRQLPRLRRGLDIFPSPVPDRPGLLFRDPFHYTDEILIIPPLLVAALSFFDGESAMLDAQAYVSKLAGHLIPGEIIESMLGALRHHGLLENEEYERLRDPRH